jgi:hypothetical protein
MGTGFLLWQILPRRKQTLGVVQPIRRFFSCDEFVIVKAFPVVILSYHDYCVVLSKTVYLLYWRVDVRRFTQGEKKSIVGGA